jgi:hypothetical protein
MHPLLEHTKRWRAWAHSLAARHARIVDGRRASGELLRWPRAGRVRAQPPAIVLELTPRIHLDLRSALTRITARGSGAAAARREPVAPAPAGTAAPRGRSAAPMVAAAETRVFAAPAGETTVRWAVLGGAPQTLPARSEPATPGRAPAVHRPAPAPALPTVDRRARHPAVSAHVAAGGHEVRRRLRRAERQAVRSRPAMVLPLAPVAAAAAHPAQQPPPEPPVRLSSHGRREPAVREALAGLDLERLADQVVQQIDRRITAHRERFGRI